MLIPAAGQGTRVGSPLAKELLPYKNTSIKLIDRALKEADDRRWPVVVITRPDKITLIDYLQNHWQFGKDPSKKILLIPDTLEWPDTLLKSRLLWSSWNFVLLPDVDYQPKSILDKMLSTIQNAMEQNVDLHGVVATHAVLKTDQHLWGFLTPQKEKLWIVEKPKRDWQMYPLRAWGIYAFHQSIGVELLQKQLQQTLSQTLDTNIECADWTFYELHLDEFEDLTRGPR